MARTVKEKKETYRVHRLIINLPIINDTGLNINSYCVFSVRISTVATPNAAQALMESRLHKTSKLQHLMKSRLHKTSKLQRIMKSRLH